METDEVFIEDKKIILGSKTIIDDILMFLINLEAILVYFECVWKLFQKYCVSFLLYKCDFLKERVECFGHDITQDVNCPEQLKFDIINYW